jgi:hypothetical protein
MELLVCLSIVPATLRPQTWVLGRKSYGPSLLIIKTVEKRKLTYSTCDAGATGVQYPLFACQGLVCKTCSVIGRRKRCQKCMRILTCSLKLVIRPAKWNAHYRGVPASSKVDKLPFLFEPDHRCKLMAATSGKPTSEPMASEASSVLGSRAHARPAFVLWVNGLTIVYTCLHDMAGVPSGPE